MRLEFIGQPGPWRDLEKFIAAVRYKKPGISEWDLMTLIHETNARLRPRNDRQQFQLFGADILSDKLSDIEGWMYVEPTWRNLIPLFPLHTGELIDNDEGGKLKMAIATRSYDLINRGSFITPPGLSRTYIWTRENNFIQDVRDRDIDLIREWPRIRNLFRPVDLANGPQVIQSLELPVLEKHSMRDATEAANFAVEMGVGDER